MATSRNLCLNLLFAVSIAAAADAPRTVILVRHAERTAGNADSITDAGRCRAEALAKILADAGVKEIFTSEAARTRQTAAPTAKMLNIEPKVVGASNVTGLVARLRNPTAKGAALVVGHSNTLPDIIGKLGGGTVPPIADTEFDRLFVMALTSTGSNAPVTLHYPGCKQ